MKKILLAIVLVLTIGLSVSAQTDGFFKDDGGSSNNNRTAADDLNVPSGVVGKIKDTNGYNEQPLGSGLLIMTSVGAGYALIRSSKSRKWKKTL